MKVICRGVENFHFFCLYTMSERCLNTPLYFKWWFWYTMSQHPCVFQVAVLIHNVSTPLCISSGGFDTCISSGGFGTQCLNTTCVFQVVVLIRVFQVAVLVHNVSTPLYISSAGFGTQCLNTPVYFKWRFWYKCLNTPVYFKCRFWYTMSQHSCVFQVAVLVHNVSTPLCISSDGSGTQCLNTPVYFKWRFWYTMSQHPCVFQVAVLTLISFCINSSNWYVMKFNDNLGLITYYINHTV